MFAHAKVEVSPHISLGFLIQETFEVRRTSFNADEKVYWAV